MKCLIIQTDEHFSDVALQEWSDIFAEMINKNKILVLPGNFHLITTVDDDTGSNIVAVGSEQNNDITLPKRDT